MALPGSIRDVREVFILLKVTAFLGWQPVEGERCVAFNKSLLRGHFCVVPSKVMCIEVGLQLGCA